MMQLCVIAYTYRRNDLNDANTISSPLLFAHYFEEKWGGGIWSNIQFISSRNFNMHGVKNHDNCFLEEWHELQEISSTCVDTNPRGIEATFIVSGDRGKPHVSCIPS